MLHEMTIAALTQDPETNAPILFLKSIDGEKTLPIWIGMLEAVSIASALQNVEFDRPMTHDLFKNFIERINADLIKIEICDLKNNTYYAKIYFSRDNGDFYMDARPSDAIALAIRFKKRIYVDDVVIVKSFSDHQKTYEMSDDSEEGKKWADYLKKLNSDDFGKYKM
ncbi:MAG: bifunctional nuclease family protein [Proteobacteria bacterium]|nr:bifunctional nuclease family protein [Pseudomonadota bacterium]